MTRRILTSDRNIPWLMAIPEHWGIVRGKALFEPRKELARLGDQQLSATQAYGVIPQKEYEQRIGRKVTQVTRHLERRRHVERDDFVISMRSFQGGLKRTWVTGCIRSSYVVLQPSDAVDVGYFSYLFKSHDYIQALRATANFIRDGQDLNFNNFCLVDLPLVPMEEQRAIAKYLDHVDRRIRRYIRAKRQLITLLNEQNQAIIHHAVTRGVDPNVRFKPSGVEWLGDVPEHWDVLSLKRTARINPARSESSHLRESSDPVVFLPMERVSVDGDVDSSEMRAIKDVWQGFTYFRRGDVLLAKITPCFENGKGACLADLVTEIGFGTTEFIVLRPSDRVLSPYLHQLTRLPHFRLLGVESMSGAAGQQRISQEFVAGFRVPLPPLKEQQEIVEFVASVMSSHRESVKRVTSQVSLVDEYRSRLIADVVTGKLDVREAAARLPDEEPDPAIDEHLDAEEPIDEMELEAEPEEVEA